MKFFLIAPILCTLIFGCSPEKAEKQKEVTPPVVKKQDEPRQPGCKPCHPMVLDKHHQMSCTDCHDGSDKSAVQEEAHLDLNSEPSHPKSMVKRCGECHHNEVKGVTASSHFTLADCTNLTRNLFGTKSRLASKDNIPESEIPMTAGDLADDLLRRSCLRCHLHSKGDRYPGVRHGSGCAACHLDFEVGKLVTHHFLALPTDKQCLQCHYGNRVGFDYYGRFEHDLNEEYRTPYTTRQDFFRPFGVEFHQLVPDIHQKAGMECVDCHSGRDLMGTSSVPSSLSCSDCHQPQQLKSHLPASITRSGSDYTLTTRREKKELRIPLMKDPAHDEFSTRVDCQVCHAQWSFNDQGLHFLRRDFDEYDDFERLTTQGHFDVEKLLLNNLDFDKDEFEPSLKDQISGELTRGVWYRSFSQRRWEKIPLGRNAEGTIMVTRPILDLHLSWTDEEENVRFDSVSPKDRSRAYRPYVPHTTGPAGLYYRNRIQRFLALEKQLNN
ncbi:MAG: hypothetical protein ABFS19_04020 [Thermodesulfobacteriota bacterium]